NKIVDVMDTLTKYKNSYFDIINCIIVNTKSSDPKLKYKDKRFIQFPKIDNVKDLTFVHKGFILDTFSDYISTIENPQLYSTNNIINYLTISHITKYPVLCKAGSSE